MQVSQKSRVFRLRFGVCVWSLALAAGTAAAQTGNEKTPSASQESQQELKVNWLYGAYVDRNVPLYPLSNHQRFQLFLRQSFLTPGVYVKTALFSLSDQAQDHPEEWGDGFGGYAKRTASRYGQFVAQNGLSGAANALLGYEPRYDRCRCTGFWPRTRHAVVRNFVTYNRTEKELRPQLGMYAGAFAGGVIAATWQPDNPGLLTKGYQGVVTQVIFGVGANWLGEFAPDIKRVLKGNKGQKSAGEKKGGR